MSEVWSLALPTTQKLVLLAMADHADDEGGNAYPSVARLAVKCGVGERTVQYALKKLREGGYLEVQKAASQHYPTSYRIHPRGAESAGRKICGAQTATSRGANDDIQGCNPLHPNHQEPSGTIKKRYCASGPTFAVFWESYPKRIDKAEALSLWQKIPLDDVPEVMAGLQRWRASDQWGDVSFVPSPARWLRRRKWEDEVPRPAEAVASPYVGTKEWLACPDCGAEYCRILGRPDEHTCAVAV